MHNPDIEFARKILIETADFVRDGCSVPGLMGIPPFSPMFAEQLAATQTKRKAKRISREHLQLLNPHMPKQTRTPQHRNKEPGRNYYEDQAVIEAYRIITRIDWPLRQLFVLHYVRRPPLSQAEIAQKVYCSQQAVSKSLHRMTLIVAMGLKKWREEQRGSKIAG